MFVFEKNYIRSLDRKPSSILFLFTTTPAILYLISCTVSFTFGSLLLSPAWIALSSPCYVNSLPSNLINHVISSALCCLFNRKSSCLLYTLICQCMYLLTNWLHESRHEMDVFRNRLRSNQNHQDQRYTLHYFPSVQSVWKRLMNNSTMVFRNINR